ncbi:unnamed protein product [Ceratitis capitata]|uniref:(Mediterranean fruit fly) hypothetical protein n=1 Tax=Ceratitis capitata TaxID=7213 RepID=A0A811UVM8_CERCA|nr:unnamed protein product [Ceratitis capitata]
MTDIRKCRAPGCENNNREISVFSFPQDTQLLQKWKENLGLDPAVELPQFNCYLRLEHFEKSAVGVGGRLRSGAVRTLKIDQPPVTKSYPDQLIGGDLTLEEFDKYSKLDEIMRGSSARDEDIEMGFEPTFNRERYS